MGTKNQEQYINTISDSCHRYPDLYRLREFLEDQHISRGLGRAAVLQFEFGQDPSIDRRDFRDVSDLKQYFQSTKTSTCKHRIYMLEDLSKQHVEAFGTEFHIDPILFAGQENSTHWIGSTWHYSLPRRLLSSKSPNQVFTLRYYEVVKEDRKISDLFLKTLTNVERKIEAGDYFIEKGKKANLNNYLVRRNASFWSRLRKDGGWDALILVDPPVGNWILVGKNRDKEQRHYWNSEPYGHGYVDFRPWPSEDSHLGYDGHYDSPPRTSILDDIAWYWTEAASEREILAVEKDVAGGAIFLKKIVASNWNVMLEFIWAKLSEFERAIGRSQQSFETSSGTSKPRGNRNKREPLEQLAEILAALHLFRRRLQWYTEEVDSSLRSMAISVDSDQNHIEDDGKELLPVLRRLKGFKEKVESLTSIVTGISSIHQAEIAQEETKWVSRLTVVALLFIPLSFSASIFSMGANFLPGNSHFWVYFATALPMTFIVLVLAWQLRRLTWI